MLKKFFSFEAVVFLSALALYSFLPVFAPKAVWNSPDEMANAFFIERFATGSGLAVADSAFIRSDGLIRPRSVGVSGGLMVPGSFLGIIVIYALPVAMFGAGVLPFLTPFFTALALLAWGGILKRFLPLPAARITVILTALHPALWYYANRGLFHNVLFLDFVIFSMFFFICQPFFAYSARVGASKPLGALLDGLLGGATVVLALATRTFEIIWLAPLFAYLWWRYRAKVEKHTVISASAIILAAAAMFMALSRFLFGSWLPSGYVVGAAGLQEEFFSRLFPFGFSLRNIFLNSWNYAKVIFWWYTLIVGAGSAWLVIQRIRNRAPKDLWLIFKIFIVVTVPLVFIYGSGQYLDTPDPSMATIGTSTVRYWLPLFVLCLPFAGWVLGIWWEKRRFYRAAAIVLILFVVVFSLRIVFWGRGEGLVYVLRELRRYEDVRAKTIELTAESAIVISDRSDKIFFPYRHVVVGTASEETVSALPSLATIGPLYVYALKIAPDDPRIGMYGKMGFVLREEYGFGREALYSLIRKP